MGLFTLAQVNRKVNVGVTPPIEGPLTYSAFTPLRYDSSIILSASVASTDSVDHNYALAFIDQDGQACELGMFAVPAPVAPADESIVSLTDPAAGLNLAGFVLPPGSAIYCRQVEAQVTGERLFSLTLGVA